MNKNELKKKLKELKTCVSYMKKSSQIFYEIYGTNYKSDHLDIEIEEVENWIYEIENENFSK